MFSIPSGSELIIILIGIVLLFGASKLPKLGGAIGESIKNFKKGIKDADSAEKKSLADSSTDTTSDKS